MRPGERYSDYDRFAWFYNRYWASRYSAQVLPVLEQFLLAHVVARSRILDLCCGVGQLAQALTNRGFRVTGIDGSEEMLRFARENAPAAEFILADARSFELPAVFQGAVSTFDSLNHVMRLDELTRVFENVHRALAKGGLFLFDLNMEEGYRVRWRGSFAIVEEDHVCAVRAAYDPEAKIGQNDITLFRLEGEAWRRSDLALAQKCYSEVEVRSAVEEAGLGNISVHNAESDFRMSGNVGRTFFLARGA